MPTIKAFSVAGPKSYDGTPTGPSGVYSYSGVPEEGLQWSGRTVHTITPPGKVLRKVVSPLSWSLVRLPHKWQHLSPMASWSCYRCHLDHHPDPCCCILCLGSRYLCCHHHNTGADHSGAGLIVRVDVAANGNMTLNANPIVDAGEGYTTATDDTAVLDLGLINPAQGAITIAA